jgi:hypothetical protein
LTESVKVCCANPQALLFTGHPCGWKGRRSGRWVTPYRGAPFREEPTAKPCPQCGSPVQLAETQGAAHA